MAGSSHCTTVLTPAQNLKNFLLTIAVAIPAFAFQYFFLSETRTISAARESGVSVAFLADQLRANGKLPREDGGLQWQASDETSGESAWERFCVWGLLNPVGLVAVLFFVNVNILFWLISLVQQSTWLIDPYWTLLPLLMAHFYAAHPLAAPAPERAPVVRALLWLWSLRLTHSYWRREAWQWGAREDWRFGDLRREHGRHWWWTSFVVVYVSQEIFLVGICLPVYAVHFDNSPWNATDVIATMLCSLAIVIGCFADTQLYNFVSANSARKQKGLPVEILLDTGLWRYSRHPNYFGEQLWWWGLALFGWNVGHGWTVIGTIVNSACMAYVTILVERRMVANGLRAEAYREYQRSTSVLVPWFPARRQKIN